MLDSIIIRGARQGNLQNIDLTIPRQQLVVLTGLSGSGKTTLAIDLLFQECQRRYLEALGMQGIKRPDFDSISGLAPAVLVTQTTANRNPRSTVGTLTGIYTDLRMLFEKLHTRACPECGALISAADCREEVQKEADEYRSYMFCPHCGYKMPKLTMAYFSFNTREGACPTCQGLGQTLTAVAAAAVDESLSLEKGAVKPWENTPQITYNVQSFAAALEHYGLAYTPNQPVQAFSPAQKALLYHGVFSREAKEFLPDKPAPKTVVGGRFEGVLTALVRRMSESGGQAHHLDKYFAYADCPDCAAERLAELPRSVTVAGYRLPELSLFSLEALGGWLADIQVGLSDTALVLVEPYLLDLATRLRRVIGVGVGYLSLDRQAVTLSGGEAQRMKLASTLDSELSGIIYIFDEPTVGLHPHDTHSMLETLFQLRDEGNSVLVIEHDTDIITVADHIIDIGPGSGRGGGQIVGQGTLGELMDQPSSVTGGYLRRQAEAPAWERGGAASGVGGAAASTPASAPPAGSSEPCFSIRNASLNNLKSIDVDFAIGKLTAVTGVSGSGKSTLVFDCLESAGARLGSVDVLGLENFDGIVRIEQAAVARMRRSNIATFTDIYTEVRKIFAGLPEAKALGLTSKHFSFNTPGGRCENCSGMGVVESNMLFFPNADITCPVCGGLRFNEEVLSVSYRGYSINGILKLTVDELSELFDSNKKIDRTVELLCAVGLGYLELGQTLTTLSGGEAQRLKLVRELLDARGSHNLYLMDEPTTGLHPLDVEMFLALLNRIVEAGNTVIVVEHNMQLILAADWVVDLGPEGGDKGGELVFYGTPAEMVAGGTGYTAQELRRFLGIEAV